jgi:hypothetical protein
MEKKRIGLAIFLTVISLPLGIGLIVASAHGPALAAYIGWLLAPGLFLFRLGVQIPVIARATIVGTLLLVGVQFFYWLAVLTLISQARRRLQSPPR